MFLYNKLQEVKLDKYFAGGKTQKPAVKRVILREQDTSECVCVCVCVCLCVCVCVCVCVREREVFVVIIRGLGFKTK